MPEDHPASSKLLPKGRQGFICEYTESTKLYQIYLKNTLQVKVSHDIIFPGTHVGGKSLLISEISDKVTKVLNFKPEKSITSITTSTNISNNNIFPQEVNEANLPKRGNIEVVIMQPISSSYKS